VCKNTTTLHAIVIIFNVILLLLFIYVYIYFLFQLIKPLLRYYDFKKGLDFEVRQAFGWGELLSGISSSARRRLVPCLVGRLASKASTSGIGDAGAELGPAIGDAGCYSHMLLRGLRMR
jgi:hypothetical protein